MASGSVLEQWVWLERFSPRKFTVGLDSPRRPPIQHNGAFPFRPIPILISKLANLTIALPPLKLKKMMAHPGGNAQKAFSYDRDLGLKPEMLSDLVPSALVIKSPPNLPAEGWGLEYEVFWKNASKALAVYSRTADIEKYILPTLSSYP